MNNEDDNPDRYEGEMTVEGVDEALNDFLGNSTSEAVTEDDIEAAAADAGRLLTAVWAEAGGNPDPQEDLGYDGQELTMKLVESRRGRKMFLLGEQSSKSRWMVSPPINVVIDLRKLA